VTAHDDEAVGAQQRHFVLPGEGVFIGDARQLVDHRDDRTLLAPAVEV
jgi:hypothetical protein